MIQEGTELFIPGVLEGFTVGYPHEVLRPAVQICHLNAEYKR